MHLTTRVAGGAAALALSLGALASPAIATLSTGLWRRACNRSDRPQVPLHSACRLALLAALASSIQAAPSGITYSFSPQKKGQSS